METLPPLAVIAFRDTVRLLQSKYSMNEDSILARLAPNDQVLQDGLRVESRTSDRLIADHGLLPGISPDELVVDILNARTINAAFTHARPDGSRFNGPERGAWYAAKAAQTALAEVEFHHTLALWEVQKFSDEMTYDEYLADFTGKFHDLRISQDFAFALDPNSYIESQRLAETLFRNGSPGIVYPSVRHSGGTCLACFRPDLVAHVRKGRTFRFSWRGDPKPIIEVA